MYDRDPQGNVVGKLKRCKGKKLDYLGMILDYSVPGQVTFRMEKYVKDMVKDFEDAIKKEVPTTKTPAADHLFMVREDAEELSEEKAQVFHNATAKALYVCKRARPDV